MHSTHAQHNRVLLKLNSRNDRLGIQSPCPQQSLSIIPICWCDMCQGEHCTGVLVCIEDSTTNRYFTMIHVCSTGPVTYLRVTIICWYIFLRFCLKAQFASSKFCDLYGIGLTYYSNALQCIQLMIVDTNVALLDHFAEKIVTLMYIV